MSDEIDLNVFFYQNQGRGTLPIGDSWCVGPRKQFTFDSLDTFGKIYVENNIVYLHREAPMNFWTWVAMIINYDLRWVLEKTLDLKEMVYHPFIVRESQTSVFGRTIEFGLCIYQNKYPIFGEFSFSNEDISDLITDCVMFLTEFKPVQYSIGAKIDSSNSNNFVLNYFVLKRGENCKPDSERKEILSDERFYASRYNTKEKNEWDVDKQDIKNCFLNGDLSKYNVDIVVAKTITTDNFNDNFSFDIDLSKIDSKKNGMVKISMSQKNLELIHKKWKYYFEEE